MSAKPVVLVDGSSYLYRAFHVPALQRLSNSSGSPTGAVHGILNMVSRLLTDFEPERIAVIFDARGKTFRKDLYAQYKANRPPMPEELKLQIEPAIKAIEALGIKVLRVQGVEADDVIGTLTIEASKAGLDTIISTTDKDMTQLVNDKVIVLNTMDDKRLDTAGVIEKFGVAPTQIIDYLTLVGDSSDNIPGVPGVGAKTAAKWLKEYGSTGTLVEHADKIGGKVGEKLRDAIPTLPLYQELVTIKCDVDLPLDIDGLARQAIDAKQLRAVLEPLEMFAFLNRTLTDEEEAVAEGQATNYETVLTTKQFKKWLKKIKAAEIVALDTETTSLNYMQAELVGISLSVKNFEAAYIPLAHNYPGVPDQLDRASILNELKPWLEDEKQLKVGHHLKYDAHVLANHGIRLEGIAEDTMLESYVLNSTATRHDMDSVALKYLGVETTHYEDVAGKGAKQLTFNQVPLEQAAPYAAEDADITLRLHETLSPRLAATGRLFEIYRDIEIPVVPILERMEHTGVLIDVEMLGRQSREFAAEMQRLETAAYDAAAGPFNLGSPKQLQEILFDRLGLPVKRKTPKGQPSTAEDVLQELADEGHELPTLLLSYRGLAKLRSTYTDKLPGQVNPGTGRVHTSYHQAVAATGRLSSSDPNLQNIPVRTAEGRRIRQAFIPPPGARLLAADYSQIELRIMAHLSGDEGLLAAFRADADIHRATAAEVFGAQPDDVSDDQRRSAKAINFGLIYGMSAFGLARQLGIERQDAQQYIDLYFDRYPGVRAYMDRTREQARGRASSRRSTAAGSICRRSRRATPSGASTLNAARSTRPCRGPQPTSSSARCLTWIGGSNPKLSMPALIMQVHDELVLEVNETLIDAVGEKIVAIMAGAAELTVPLVVDRGIGLNWDEAH